MRMAYWAFWGVVAVSTLAAEVSAQQGVRWAETSVDGARRTAAQTGRLVLVHFWSPSCRPCLNMERNVFSQPQVAEAIEANYVSVKINADHFPHTCRQYGITALPTDMILTAEGQPVRRFQGETSPGPYVTRLNEVAATTGRRAPPAYAQGPAVGGARDAVPPASGPSPPRHGEPNWGGYVRDRENVARNQPPPPRLAQAAPRYNDQPRRQPEPSRQRPFYDRSAAPPAQGPPSSPGPAGSASSPQVPVAANPPVGLDGYCPVELCERQRWVLGNRRWGAIHRGRTYLFAGPEEQRRFLDAPDRYAPVISGDDVVLSLDRGERVAGRREHGVYFRGQVYLFSNEATLEAFARDPSRYAEQVLQTMRPGRSMPYR